MLFAPIMISMLNILTNHTMLTKKRSNLYCIIAYIINALFLGVLLNYINSIVMDPAIYKYLSYSVGFSFIFYIIMVFEDPFSIKLFAMLSTWIFSTIILLISSLIYDLIEGYNASFHIINATSVVFHILLFVFFYKGAGKKFRETLEKINKKIIYLMSTYLMIAFIFLIKSSSWDGKLLSNAVTIFEMILLMVFIILGYLIVFFGISSASKNVLLEHNLDIITKQSDTYYKLANYDILTGIANRQYIMNYILEKLNDYKNTDEKLFFIMFDLDKFKAVNDNYGHKAGDEALKFVVNRLKNCIREDDFIGRLGGDEFIIISNNMDTQTDAELLISRIIKALETPFKIGKESIYIDISIGVSIFPTDGLLIDDLLEKSDQAMYKAKARNGTSYEFFSDLL